jgi:cytochrome c oxidase assembly factor CtaG
MDWDAFIRSHRLARALGLAVMLAGFLVWWHWDGDPGPVRAT